MNKAVFLDRDGVVNREVDLLRNLKDLRLIAGSAQAIAKLNHLGYKVIVITNQAVVARGWLSEKELNTIHQEIFRRVKKKEGIIDHFYYCPHHPNADLIEYRQQCLCRKPNTGLIDQAVKDFNIDLKSSFFIGDSTGDIQTGLNAHLKTILVLTGYAGKDGKYPYANPDFTVANLLQAALLINSLIKK